MSQRNTRKKKREEKEYSSEQDTVLRSTAENILSRKCVRPQISLLREITDRSIKTLLGEPCFVETECPICVLGDLHGQLDDLIRIFQHQPPPPAAFRGCENYPARFLFLGDYVDRGTESIPVLVLLLCLKLLHCENILLLRGNHESSNIARYYGFYDECQRYYPGGTVFDMFVKLFDSLPFAALIEGSIFCVHGGISPELRCFDDITNLQRPSSVECKGLLCDLLWSDPCEEESSVGFFPNEERGVSVKFGLDTVERFLKDNSIDLICRAHQVQPGGYSFLGNDRRLVTLFSASNYMGEFDNHAAMMVVDANVCCSFVVFDVARTK